MIFTKQQVYDKCKFIAPQYNFEPKLIYAVCLQEGGKNKEGNFAPDIARLEPRFYLRYTNPMLFATTSECLFAVSYGIMQMMGLSLKEVGYFHWYFEHCDEGLKKIIKSPLSQFAVPSAIDAYCVNLDWMILWGTRWMSKKRDLAKGDIRKTLGLWNGDLSGKYYNEVMSKYNSIKD